MATIRKLRGRVIELGSATSDRADDKGRAIHMLQFSRLFLQTAAGERVELPGCSVIGEAAAYGLGVGSEIELLCSNTIPVSKSRGGRATMVYALRLVGETDWMGADTAHIAGGMRGQMVLAAAMFFVLIPIAALGTFFAFGAGGLLAAWGFFKCVRAALKLPSHDDIKAALAGLERQPVDLEAPTLPAGAWHQHDLLRG